MECLALRPGGLRWGVGLAGCAAALPKTGKDREVSVLIRLVRFFHVVPDSAGAANLP